MVDDGWTLFCVTDAARGLVLTLVLLFDGHRAVDGPGAGFAACYFRDTSASLSTGYSRMLHLLSLLSVSVDRSYEMVLSSSGGIPPRAYSRSSGTPFH